MIRRHRLLRQNGFDSDLLLLLDDAGDYRQPMRAAVTDTLRLIGGENTLGQPGGVHIADAGVLSVQDRGFLYAAADVVYDYADEFLPEHRQRARRPAPVPPPVPREYPADGEATEGGFPAYEWDDKNEFHFHVRGTLPPAAWSHLLANPGFGALVTDAGTGYLWRGNARENKLTPWVNDPLSLCGGESFTLRTKDGVFSLFAGDDGLPCDITYGFGRAVFEKSCGAVRTKLTLFVPPDRMARVALLEVTSGEPVTLRHLCRPVLGPTASMARHVVTACDGGMLTATNPYNCEFSPQTFFVRAEPPFSRYTCSEASLRQNRFDSLSGAGYDPCLAFELTLPPAEPGRPARAVIVTGCAQNAPGLALLSQLCGQAAARDALERTVSYWGQICRGLKLSTANPDLDRYAGGWAAYQALCCRVMARTSLYQCGGAYGFRDQLQDVCGLLPFAPQAARAQILRAAAHQFEQGDVQHWWHPGPLSAGQGHKGVRTRCSDDYLWLPYAVCRYVRVTGDEAVLPLEIPWLQAAPLARHEQERYDTPAVTPGRESLYEHCLRACRLALRRGTGRHGLPYIGSGDWNDGYNRVGKNGQGESVWLAFFMAMTLRDMAGLCSRRQDEEESKAFLTFAAALEDAAGKAWDGNWFIRAYYDDGSALGAAESRQCQIDSLPQSFSALSGRADRQQVSRALLSALDLLKKDRERLVLLFAPPFGGGGPDPGYIKGYLPGVRENGGQYTHAAVWLAAGLMAAGKAREGYEVLDLLLPARHPEDIYRVEPYVIAADVYSNPAYLGRGGWSWYTGAAGWFLRTVTEDLLGIRVEDGFLTVRPALSEAFASYRADIRVSGADYHIEADTEGVTVNGRSCPAGGVSLPPGSYNVSKLRVENSPGV